jgi:hypothetical protein
MRKREAGEREQIGREITGENHCVRPQQPSYNHPS